MRNKEFQKLKQNLLQYKLFDNIKKLKHCIIKDDTLEDNPDFLNDAEYVTIEWPEKVTMPKVGIVKDCYSSLFTPKNAYWPKYQRYLEHNDIPYEFYDIYKSNWIEESQKFDIIIWHTSSDPATQRDAKTKIYLLENYLGILCHPNYNEIWSYEDKVRQYYLFKKNNLPVIDTFISNNKEEVVDFIKTTEYPFISKISTGSGSQGVQLIENKREAIRYINKVFAAGRNTYWTYVKQKDYVYFQKFISDALFDLRVIVIGNKYFGYYRMKPHHDFRASGAGHYVKKGIPKEALLIARDVKEKFNTTMLAVDMLKSENEGNYKIIEASIFIQVDTAEQLKVNNIAGFYEYNEGNFIFKSGKYWIQEIALNEVMKKWIEKELKKRT